MQKTSLPASMSFMGLRLQIADNVFAPDTDEHTQDDPSHRAVEAEVRAGERGLDMGTGSGVSALLAARRGAEIVAVDVNPDAVECARSNAEVNGLAGRISFLVAAILDGVEGA